MKHNLVLSILFLSFLLVIRTTKAGFLDCNEEKSEPLSGSGIETRVADDTSVKKHKVRDFFKKVACQIKKGGSKVKELAKKIGTGTKNQAKKLGQKAKDLGSKIKAKFQALKKRLFGRSGQRNGK